MFLIQHNRIVGVSWAYRVGRSGSDKASPVLPAAPFTDFPL